MDGFSYRRRRLHCEDLPVASLAERYGTPLYIYSRSALLSRFRELRDAFAAADPLICYSVKANSNLSILRLLARAGAGFDVVSGGELFRVRRAGGACGKVVFAGVGKTHEEIEAAVRARICLFDVESVQELEAIHRVCGRLGTRARVALRLNPGVDARTNAKTTTGKKENKFGIDLDRARDLFARRADYGNVALCGVHLHLGSPIYSTTPFRAALRKTADFVAEMRGLGAQVDTLNVGGGYCISYDGRRVIGPADYARTILPAVKKIGVRLVLEPGRYISGNAGILVSRVTYVKQGWHDRKFVVIDAAMNDLLRPALYGSYHHVWPAAGSTAPLLRRRHARASRKGLEKVDVVGPICESSDSFARDRILPKSKAGDLLAVFGAGAYGMSMSSNYNSRPRACEVLVSGNRVRVIRRRETCEDLVRGE